MVIRMDPSLCYSHRFRPNVQYLATIRAFRDSVNDIFFNIYQSQES